MLGHVEVAEDSKNDLFVVCSSDRGLCGGIHSGLTKTVKREFTKNTDGKIAILGQKCRTQLQRTLRPNIGITFDGVTKFTVSWYETSLIGDLILKQNIKPESTKIVYNSFKSVIAYEPSIINVPSVEKLMAARNIIFI